MLRSLTALRSVDAGFSANDVLTMQVTLPETRYRTPAQITAFFDAALERMRAIPGVRAAGAIDDLPTQGGSVQPIVREGRAELLPRDQPTVEVRKVLPGYLASMQIPLLQGRDVAPDDRDVMLVSRSAAKLLWGNEDPIGTRVTLPLQSRTMLKQVIGIVGDVKQGALSEASAPTVYEFTRERDWRGMAIVLRTAVPPLSVGPQARDVIRSIDPQQPVEDVRTMDAILEETLSSPRFSAWLLGLFASVALALASVGIYSVLSYIVRGRSREIGIRAALGARTSDVVRLVLIEGMTPTLAGVGLGVVAALGAAEILSGLIFGVSASDPGTLAAVAAVMILVAVVASLVPAYRACRVDPLEVLRSS
jgi:predicted permease